MNWFFWFCFIFVQCSFRSCFFYISAFFTVICRFVRIGEYIAFFCSHLPTHIEMLSPGVQCFFGFVWFYFLYGWVSCQPDRTMLKIQSEFKELTSHRNHVSLISRRWINPLHRNSIYTMKQVSWPCSVSILYMNLLLHKTKVIAHWLDL